ncbi:MAG TPA: hypothetical protein VGY77_08190 [Gemmataceae bacterium]|nr:hypothetical protein [Gemmataceae bacterium]
MQGLPSPLLAKALRLYFTLAYPDGDDTIPPAKAALLTFSEGPAPETLFVSSLCQTICDGNGIFRGFSFRLGSSAFPHLKMQIIECEKDRSVVFAVDTHDGISLEPGHPDAEKWTHLQAANRRLKEKIEKAWEGVGLLTFNGLLRRDLNKNQ